MPRFVILEHDHPHLHWDLMLEDGDTLRTWRLSEAPTSLKRILCEELVPHRRFYLDYEGEVSGGRGFVRRWDWGEYVRIDWWPDGELLDYSGQQGRGVMTLDRIDAGQWRFMLYIPAATSEPASERSA